MGCCSLLGIVGARLSLIEGSSQVFPLPTLSLVVGRKRGERAVKRMLFVVVIALAAAAPASASIFRGTVVARSAGSLAVASRSGVVRIVYVSSRARVGSLVRVSGTRVAVVG